MTEHPILFSTEMVKAILDGRKTMTRRIIKRGVVGRMMSGDQILWPYIYDKQGKSVAVPCPYGQPGDLLWVRETWRRHSRGIGYIEYKSDGSVWCDSPNGNMHPVPVYQNAITKWRPSIHMPRWASRITLEVTDVRVGRVQDIREDDAKAEGVTPDEVGSAIDTYPHRSAFNCLWDKINAKRGYSWNSNPWVWVVEFKRL